MSKPWDIPAFAGRGDKTPNLTYEAVGRALSAWEDLEVSLSYLFGIFSDKPPLLLETYAEYGKPTIFVLRADALEKSAERYFVGQPNQHRESAFSDLVCDIRHFSSRRNDIEHGV